MKNRNLHIFFIAAILLSLFVFTPATPAHAASLVVNTLKDENDHSCMDGDCSLRDALEAANDGDVISFSVTGTISMTLGNLLVMDDVTISGPGSSQLTINGNLASQIFEIFNPQNVVITGLTLTNGLTNNCGGAMYATSGSLITIDDVVFSNNQALKNGMNEFIDGGAICIFDGGTLSISNSTFINNTAWRAGGAIAVYYASVTLSNVVMDGNKAVGSSTIGSSGGAIYIFSDQSIPSSAILNHVTITDNSSTYQGGGIFIQDYANITIQDSVIQGNHVTGYASLNDGEGGGIATSANSMVQIINTTISHNTAYSDGGGITSYGANFTIQNSLISNNQAGTSEGGGIFMTGGDNGSDGAFTLENTTVSGNSGYASGGIYTYLSALSLKNVTITNNIGNYIGGLIVDSPASFSMANTLIANNTALQEDDHDCYTVNTLLPSLGHNLVESAPHCFTPAAGDIVGLDPKLNPLADNGGSTLTHGLQIGSPALDAGDNANCLATDQRGINRPQDGDNNSSSICDIGAFEKVYAAPTATFADVPVNYWAWQFVEGIYMAGVTGGCGTNPLVYCPTNPVTRAQMAVFLLKSLHGGSYAPPPIGAGTGFNDVPSDYWAAGWIKQLAAEGITSGCGNGNYCPDATVTRDQMAVFLLKSKYGNTYVPPTVGAGTGFTDVPADHWAAAWIKQLAAEAITGGCGSGLYCPGNQVTRDQMAVFLQKTFSLPTPKK